jgi:hypothetical protein
VQNLQYSGLLSKNINFTVYGATILPVDLYGGETWSLRFMVEDRLRVFEERVLK